MARRIKNASEITDAKKSYIMEFPEEQKPQKQTKHHRKRKKHDMRLGKITKKDISENSNKRKEKQNSFLPPDVAAMQADVEFIKQQIAQSARSKESHKYNKSNPSDLGKAKMTNKEKTARERELINERRQSEINKIYEKMIRKNIDNNISQSSMKTINQQLEANKTASRNKLPKNNIDNNISQRKNIDNNISRSSMKSINAQKAEEKGV